MRRDQKKMRLLALALSILLPFNCVLAMAEQPQAAEGATIREVITEIGDNAIRYPQLEGMADEAVQQKINNDIVEKAKIAQRMVTLTTLQDGGTGLTVSYDAYLANGVFSVAISAKGILENGRNGHEYAALTYDTSKGEPLTLSGLFADPDAAVAHMEAELEATYYDELSSYLENSEITPLPKDSFAIDADGVTFYYPYRQFSLLSGYSGAVQFNYSELSTYLKTEADALPAKMQIIPAQLSDKEIKSKIEQIIASGTLPQTKVKIGDAMTDVIAKYRLIREPDQFPGGRYFQLEAPAFRRIVVLSDSLTSGWDQSAVTGILSLRANLYGIAVGQTTQQQWRAILGEPTTTVEFDESLAFDYGLPAGTADYYTYGERQLLLYAGGDAVLYAVRIT